jgi:hypothetical protein
MIALLIRIELTQRDIAEPGGQSRQGRYLPNQQKDVIFRRQIVDLQGDPDCAVKAQTALERETPGPLQLPLRPGWPARLAGCGSAVIPTPPSWFVIIGFRVVGSGIDGLGVGVAVVSLTRPTGW